MKQWTLGWSSSPITGKRYNVAVWTAPWWRLALAHAFHRVACRGVLRSNWLSNRHWYHWADDWVPLYVWADLHCKLNTAKVRENVVCVDITTEQAQQLGAKDGRAREVFSALTGTMPLIMAAIAADALRSAEQAEKL